MGGKLLSQICDVFCKDYRHSVGGLPDLVLWDPAAKTCKVCYSVEECMMKSDMANDKT